MTGRLRIGPRRSGALMALGALLLALGLVAGIANRNLLDGERFAQHADAIRQDHAVARQLGGLISAAVIDAQPNLIAVRPLLQAAATTMVESDAFSPIVRSAVRSLHESLTGRDADIAIRVTDIATVIAAILPSVAPGIAVDLPLDFSVTIERVGEHSAVQRAVRLIGLSDLLSWLLPLLSAVCFLLGWAMARDRPRAVVRAGLGIAGAGALIGLGALAWSIAASVADSGTLHGAVLIAAWHQFDGALWGIAALTLAGGLLLSAAASGRLQDMRSVVAEGWARLSGRSGGRAQLLARGAACAVVGAGLVLRPALTIGVLGALAGVLLLLIGVGDAAAAIGARARGASRQEGHGAAGGPADQTASEPVDGRPTQTSGPASPDPERRRRRRIASAIGFGAVALIVAVIVVDASPADVGFALARPQSGDACNGHRELCDRPYNDVAYPATHNSMAAADAPGWFIPEQPTGLIGQLDDGMRMLLIDTYYGQQTERSGIVSTAPQSYAAALADTEANFGPEVVASALRLRDGIVSRPVGPVRPYMCHGLCEIGSTEWAPEMGRVKAWLDAHPREVVSFFIEDSVSAADTADVFRRAGLLPYVHTQEPGQPWPTLGQMIDSGRRVVVFMQRESGGAANPWLMQGFDWVQDTPYSNPTAASLSCELNRGGADHPLLLLNYWLSNNFLSLVSDARTINAYPVMQPYVSACELERGQIPNFVAVNYYNEGALLRVVDELNGFD